jgi:hypothetical protein
MTQEPTYLPEDPALDAWLRKLPTEPPAADLAARIMAASVTTRQMRKTPRVSVWQQLRDMLVIPQPAFVIPALLMLGMLGSNLWSNTTTTDAFFSTVLTGEGEML